MTKTVEQKNYLTTETRWRLALANTQAEGVLVFDNYPSCCGTCTFAEIDQLHPDTDHVSFHNSQGRGLKFVNGVPYNFEKFEQDDTEDEYYYGEETEYEETRLATSVWWSFSTLKAAQALYAALKAQGFEVDWDGTEARCVEVKFPEPKISDIVTKNSYR